MRNNAFAIRISTAFPNVPTSYNDRVSSTIEMLRIKDNASKRNIFKLSRLVACTAAALMAVLALSGCAFAVRPALAADIPVVNQIVYAVSPSVKLNDTQMREIDHLTTSAVSAMMLNDWDTISRLMYKDSITENESLCSAITYWKYLALSEELTEDMSLKEMVSIETEDITGDRKAFRYTISTEVCVRNKDSVVIREPVILSVIENINGFSLEKVSLQSLQYMEYCREFDMCKLLDTKGEEIVEINAAYMHYCQLHRNEETSRSEKKAYLLNIICMIQDLDITADEKESAIHCLETEISQINDVDAEIVTYEDLAAELMARYHDGRVSGIVADFSDILERNEKTDLFFYEAQLAADKVRLGYLSPLEAAEPGHAETVSIVEETETFITMDMLVYTNIRQGITKMGAEELRLTFSKEKPMIIGYDRMSGDGVYLSRLKPLAEQYVRQGYAWSDANKKAYQELLSEIEKYVKNGNR